MAILRRASFLLIVLFWTAMNVWLWRSEFAGKDELGSAIPAAGVWQRILTAPDDSSLDIYHRGKKIGHCRWRANVGEEISAGKIAPDEPDLEGRVKKLASYTIDIEGNLLLEESARIRFDLHSRFGTNHSWQEFSGRAQLRPQIWEIRALAAEQTLRLAAQDDESKWERQFSFADLANPARLLQELGGSPSLALLGLPSSIPAASSLSLGLVWSARKDWFTIGHSRVRAYRLQAKLLDRHQAIVTVSRVGEILRVELPHDIVLVNEAFVPW